MKKYLQPRGLGKTNIPKLSHTVEKLINVTFAHMEDSDQSWHLPSLIGVVAMRSHDTKDLSFLHVDRKDYNQTGRSSRLI